MLGEEKQEDSPVVPGSEEGQRVTSARKNLTSLSDGAANTWSPTSNTGFRMSPDGGRRT